MQRDVYPVISSQCEEFLRTYRVSVVEETPVVAAPFVACSIYSGTLHRRFCDPATKPRRFVTYRLEE